MLTLTPLKHTIDSKKSTDTGLTVFTRGPEITRVTTLLQFLPQLNVLPCASLSNCYFLFAGTSPTRIEGVLPMNLLPTIVPCIAYMPLIYAFISLSLDSLNQGLGMPWLIIQAKNLCTSKSPLPPLH